MCINIVWLHIAQNSMQLFQMSCMCSRYQHAQWGAYLATPSSSSRRSRTTPGRAQHCRQAASLTTECRLKGITHVTVSLQLIYAHKLVSLLNIPWATIWTIAVLRLLLDIHSDKWIIYYDVVPGRLVHFKISWYDNIINNDLLFENNHICPITNSHTEVIISWKIILCGSLSK